ncbi:MAG: hypothetical protein U1E76_17985 [Planctomycetota bacterium]
MAACRLNRARTSLWGVGLAFAAFASSLLAQSTDSYDDNLARNLTKDTGNGEIATDIGGQIPFSKINGGPDPA